MHSSSLVFLKDYLAPNEVYNKSALVFAPDEYLAPIDALLDSLGIAARVGFDSSRGDEPETIPVEAASELVIAVEYLQHAPHWDVRFSALAKLAQEALIVVVRGPGWPREAETDMVRLTYTDLVRASLHCGLHPVAAFQDSGGGVCLKAVRGGFPAVCSTDPWQN